MEDKNFNISYNILTNSKKSNSINYSDLNDENDNSKKDETSNHPIINTNKCSKNPVFKSLEKFKINPKINISEIRKDNIHYKSNA